jgi:hypothetical protein
MKKLSKAAHNRTHLSQHKKNTLDYYDTVQHCEYEDRNMPFYILGCPRSGTTLVRDLLREHPRLECPEETHFFRWSDPFGSPKFMSHYRTKVMKHHRELDKISEMEFGIGMEFCHSRQDMAYNYGKVYLDRINKPDARLYDKTPQNVYGMFLINAIYPKAKFIHIYRNPLNVVASLVEGKVMPAHSLRGAINSWVECMLLIKQFKQFKPELLLEVCYEDLTADPDPHLKAILEFVDEDYSLLPSQKSKTHPEKNKYKKTLSEQEIRIVLDKCEPFLSEYGYGNQVIEFPDKRTEKKGIFSRLLKR